jgi:hypothetical protein
MKIENIKHLQMSSSFVLVSENTSGLNNKISTSSAPWNLLWVSNYK